MCLIFVARQYHPEYPLIVVANRDEFYERPTAPAAFHEDAPGVLGGRDLRCGGTWLGITLAGRFAAVTNYRDPHHQRDDARSRGELVNAYLLGSQSTDAYLSELECHAGAYNGFNLIVGDMDELWCYSNVTRRGMRLEAGLYGLSNHLLDSPWPKVERGKQILRERLKGGITPERLLEVLADRTRPEDEALPDTGVGIEWERVLSSAFINSPGYGTRSSTVVLVDRDQKVTFVERSFDPNARETGTARFEFRIRSPIRTCAATV